MNNSKLESRIEDLEDIIRILINTLENKDVSIEEIKLLLRTYHYCYDCMNHYRVCKCGESSDNDDTCESSESSESIDDKYTSSECNSVSDLESE